MLERIFCLLQISFWIQNFNVAAEDGVVRWLVPANNRLSHFRRDENLKKERIKNKTSHMLQAKITLSYVNVAIFLHWKYKSLQISGSKEKQIVKSL